MNLLFFLSTLVRKALRFTHELSLFLFDFAQFCTEFKRVTPEVL